MAVKVNVVKRKIPDGPNAGTEKYYGRVKSNEKIPFARLCEKISEFSSATKGDVALVLSGFVDKMKEYMQSGFIIQLGDLGNFRLVAGSCGTDTAEEFHASCIKCPRYVFTPGKLLKEALLDVRFERMDVKVEEVDEECWQAH